MVFQMVLNNKLNQRLVCETTKRSLFICVFITMVIHKLYVCPWVYSSNIRDQTLRIESGLEYIYIKWLSHSFKHRHNLKAYQYLKVYMVPSTTTNSHYKPERHIKYWFYLLIKYWQKQSIFYLSIIWTTHKEFTCYLNLNGFIIIFTSIRTSTCWCDKGIFILSEHTLSIIPERSFTSTLNHHYYLIGQIDTQRKDIS